MGGRGKGDKPLSPKRAIAQLRKRRAKVGTRELARELGIPEPSLRRILSTGKLGRLQVSPVAGKSAIRTEEPGRPSGGKRPRKAPLPAATEKTPLSPQSELEKLRERAERAEKELDRLRRREEARDRKRERDRSYQRKRRELRRDIREQLGQGRYFGREGAEEMADDYDMSDRVFWVEFRREYRKGKK